jgi:hypothetical protein
MVKAWHLHLAIDMNFNSSLSSSSWRSRLLLVKGVLLFRHEQVEESFNGPWRTELT